MNLNEFFEKLASNNSRNFKLAELEKHKDNDVLRQAVFLALDPFTNFYQRKIPAYSYGAKRPNYNLAQALEDLYILSSRQVTGNAAISYLADLLGCLSEDDAKVIERVVKKDLKCGVSISTANDVWPGLVHEYPVMLCSAFDQKLVNKMRFPAIVQKKEDGMRFNAIVREGSVEFRSRNGKEIQLLGELEDEFIALAGGMDVVFDGELLVATESNVFLDRQTGNGILNKANKGTIKLEEAKKVHAQLWDMIPYIYFVNGHAPVPYMTRYNNLCGREFPEKLHVVETAVVQDLDEAQKIFESYLEQGFEGIILKDGFGEWEDKRAKHQIKFKGEEECDLEVISVDEGTGKHAGRLGAVVCRSRPKDGVSLTVSVGSGFNDAQRDSLWADRDKLVGKIVAVKYNMRIKNKQGEESLFLPVFIELREDKDVADAIGDIK